MNKKTNKNYGIEALRIFSMFFIIVTHVLGHGGALGQDFRVEGYSYFSNTLLKIIAICAVNCYAMISGYVGYREGKDNTEKRITKYVLMWLQVVCYNFGIALLFYFLKPSSNSISKVFEGIFPVATMSYWYFTAYTGVYMLMPLLNSLIKEMNTEKLNRVMICLLSVFSVYATIVVLLLKKDIFVLQGGYSFAWLMLLYLVGAWIKKNMIFQKITSRCLILGLIFSVFITYIVEIFKTGHFSLALYISPTIVFNAFALLCLFAKGSGFFKKTKIVPFFAPTTFGVYLGHDNSIVRKYIVSRRFEWIANESVLSAPISALLVSMIIFLFFSLIEKTRIQIFKLLKVEWILSTIYHKVKGKIKRKGHDDDT